MRRDEIFLRFVFASLSGQKRGPGVAADGAQKEKRGAYGLRASGVRHELGELRDDLGSLHQRRQGDGGEQRKRESESGELEKFGHLIPSSVSNFVDYEMPRGAGLDACSARSLAEQSCEIRISHERSVGDRAKEKPRTSRVVRGFLN